MTDSRDILISRIAENEASARDFETFMAMAEQSPAMWREVVETMRDRAALDRLVAVAGDQAERIDVDERTGESAPASCDAEQRSTAAVLTTIGRWSGWAVAAVLLLAVVLGLPWQSRSLMTNEAGELPVQQAGLASSLSAREAFEHYLARGREEGTVLSAGPQRVLLETRPSTSGEGYELIYLQQVVERTVVPELYHYGGQDEHGRPALVSYDQPARPSM
jgi:hypothetical protein